MTGLVSPSGGREHVFPLAPDGQMMMVLMLLTWLLNNCGNALKQIGQPMLAPLLLWLGIYDVSGSEEVSISAANKSSFGSHGSWRQSETIRRA